MTRQQRITKEEQDKHSAETVAKIAAALLDLRRSNGSPARTFLDAVAREGCHAAVAVVMPDSNREP